MMIQNNHHAMKTEWEWPEQSIFVCTYTYTVYVYIYTYIWLYMTVDVPYLLCFEDPSNLPLTHYAFTWHPISDQIFYDGSPELLWCAQMYRTHSFIFFSFALYVMEYVSGCTVNNGCERCSKDNSGTECTHNTCKYCHVLVQQSTEHLFVDIATT